MTIITHDPDAILDYVFNWTDWFSVNEDNDFIISQTVTVSDDLTLTSSAISSDGMKVVAWISGGTVNDQSTAVCHIVTSAGRQDDRTMQLWVQER